MSGGTPGTGHGPGSDEALIAELKYRYVRYLDTKAWDRVEELFSEDATASYGGGAYERKGRKAIMEFLVTNMGSQTMHSAHRVGQPEIAVSGDTATGRWALDDTVLDPTLGVLISGAAFYEDTYVRAGSGWLIASTGYRRLYEYMVPIASMEHFALTASWWGTDGRSTLHAE